MSKEEFEKYLVSIGGLVRTYKEYKGPIVEAGWFSVDEGWYDMIKELIDELIQLGWNKRVIQIKQKFGVLQVYVEDMPNGGFAVLGKYSRKSFNICEKCGQPSVLRKGDWLHTLCDIHADGREEYKLEKQ